MDLLEYQAKQLFAQVQIPVLPSQPLLTPSDLKKLQIPYPVVLKSQVLSSERIKSGGVRFVENTIDAIAVAQSLFNLPIKGEYPQVILAEARYDVENELFLAIMLDYALKKPVLLGSACGGDNLEYLLKNLQQCVIQEEFSSFYARELAIKMGFMGDSIASVSNIIEKMYDLLITYDLDLIEINPLGINHNGEFMALDGKIRINDYALNLHQNLLEYLNLPTNAQDGMANSSNQIILDSDKEFHQILDLDFNSNLSIITDNLDQGIFTINSCQNKQQKIKQCQILLLKNNLFWQNNIYSFLFQIIQDKKIKIVLINHSNQDEFVDILLDKITTYYQSQNQQKYLYSQDRIERQTGVRDENNLTSKTNTSFSPSREIHWIIRKISGLNNQEQQIQGIPIQLTTSLDDAIELIKNIKC